MAWNDGGDYQVDIDCVKPPTHTLTESPSAMPARSPLPGCNGSVMNTIANNPQSHMYSLTLTNTTDVTFSDCDSQTDIRLKVLNASSHVISDPYCHIVREVMIVVVVQTQTMCLIQCNCPQEPITSKLWHGMMEVIIK
eukprot:982508_1